MVINTMMRESLLFSQPFFIGEGVDTLDTERKHLRFLLVALWKDQLRTFRRSEYVAFSDAHCIYIFEYPEKQ